MNDHEDQDPTWELLKRAREIEISPAFTRDVLREARKLGASPPRGVLGWFTRRWGVAMAGVAALLALGVFVVLNSGQRPAAEEQAVATSPSPARPYAEEISIEEFTAELEELAFMSELLEVPDPSLLPDEDLAALLF